MSPPAAARAIEPSVEPTAEAAPACVAGLAAPSASVTGSRGTVRDRAQLVAWLAYATCAVVWGSTYLAIAVALDSFTPYGMVAVRFGIAAVLTLGLGRLLGEPLPSARELPHLLWVGTLLLGICNTLVVWSETHVSSGVAAVLCALVPAWFAVLTMKSEPLGARGWAGTALGLAGVAVLVAPSGGHAIDLAGVGALLVSTALWAVGTLHHRNHVRGGGVLTNAGVEMVAAAVIGNVAAPFFGGFVTRPPTPRALVAVGYLAIFGSCLAYTAHSYLAKAWNPVRSGTYAYLNPVIAVVLGAALLGERFTPRMGLGMAVILAGVALVQYRGRWR